jgi:hypothetical protein
VARLSSRLQVRQPRNRPFSFCLSHEKRVTTTVKSGDNVSRSKVNNDRFESASRRSTVIRIASVFRKMTWTNVLGRCTDLGTLYTSSYLWVIILCYFFGTIQSIVDSVMRSSINESIQIADLAQWMEVALLRSVHCQSLLLTASPKMAKIFTNYWKNVFFIGILFLKVALLKAKCKK